MTLQMILPLELEIIAADKHNDEKPAYELFVALIVKDITPIFHQNRKRTLPFLFKGYELFPRFLYGL